MLKVDDTLADSTNLEKLDRIRVWQCSKIPTKKLLRWQLLRCLAESLELRCEVCGDMATGRHYGTIACNGCKGFFRRTIRRSYKYTCRFNGNCSIDKHNRAVCRSCRYMRCINAGMRIDAVQNERDVIGKRQTAASTSPNTGQSGGITVSAAKAGIRRSLFPRQLSTSSNGANSPPETPPSPSTSWYHPKALLESLLASEKAVQRLRDTVIKQTSGFKYSKTDPPAQVGEGDRKATVDDIFSSLHSQLLLVIEWAKTLAPFAALSTDDQTALLKHFACQHVVLCVTYRSKDDMDVLKLLNNSCIPRVKSAGDQLYPDRFYVQDCERMMDELVAPMRFLKMDDVEFVALKACILFNPVARGLSSDSRNKILESRRQVFAALQYYVNNKIPSDPNRIGDLTFFVLSPLQTLANNVSEDILVSKLSGMARIDQLMEELILAETDGQNNSCSNVQHSRIEKLPESTLSGQPYTFADCMEYASASYASSTCTLHQPLNGLYNRTCTGNQFSHFSTPPEPTLSSKLDTFATPDTSSHYQYITDKQYLDSFDTFTTATSQF